MKTDEILQKDVQDSLKWETAILFVTVFTSYCRFIQFGAFLQKNIRTNDVEIIKFQSYEKNISTC